MAKHRAVIIGAGRIGAGFNWHDDAYTHAGAYRALSDRVKLVGIVEIDVERATRALQRWEVPVYENFEDARDIGKPDIVSVCVGPYEQKQAYLSMFPWNGIKGIWQEKPFMLVSTDGAWKERPFTDGSFPPIQVNYLRRGDHQHRWMAEKHPGGLLRVHGKDDIHTVCHFKDLAEWWKCGLEYHPQDGPCHYYYNHGEDWYAFPNGGLEVPGDAMKAMLGNLLDHIDKGDALWSPPT